MKSELVVLHFDTAEAAQQTMASIRTLEAEGFLQLEEAALITRAEDGTASVTSLGGGDGKGRPAMGAVMGLVAGGIVGVPILGALAVGGVATKKLVENKVRDLDTLLATVAKRVESGSTALALSVESLSDPEMVTDRLSIHRDEMTRVEIPAELRAEIDAHRTSD